MWTRWLLPLLFFSQGGCYTLFTLFGPQCGDGSQEAGEACDDGNESDNDGCN